MSQPRVQFNQQPWNQRFQKLGDEAESVFEAVAVRQGWKYVRTGLNRPPVDMRKLPQMVRYTPDYLLSSGYVEVQGFGKDRIFKLKDEKLDSLMDWHTKVFHTSMFVWDNVAVRWGIIPMQMFDETIMPCNVTGEYPEGKAWRGWTPEYLEIEWQPYAI